MDADAVQSSAPGRVVQEPAKPDAEDCLQDESSAVFKDRVTDRGWEDVSDEDGAPPPPVITTFKSAAPATKPVIGTIVYVPAASGPARPVGRITVDPSEYVPF